MNDGALLLRGILETPDCDTARLVYADHLEENGKVGYAAYIRQQIWMPPMDPHCFVGGHDSMGWFPGTHEVGGQADYAISRGFIYLVKLPWNTFFEHVATIFATHPVTKVILTDCQVYPSGGNSTFYLGGLGQFPQKYWALLENLPSTTAVLDAANGVCVSYGRELAGLPPLPTRTEAKV